MLGPQGAGSAVSPATWGRGMIHPLHLLQRIPGTGARMPDRKRGAAVHSMLRTAKARSSKPAKPSNSIVTFNRGLGVTFPTTATQQKA